MVLEAYDLNIHHNGAMVGQISNIYADRYSYVDLETDVWQLVLPRRRPCNGVKLVFHYDVLDGRKKELVESDVSLMNMFATHTMTKLIEVYVYIVEEDSSHLNEPLGGVVLNEPEEVKNDPSASEQLMDQKSEEQQPGVNQNVDSDKEKESRIDVVRGADFANENEAVEGTDLEDSSSYTYDSDDEDGEWTTDSEEEDIEGKRLKVTKGTLPYLNKEGKVVLEKGMVFHNSLHFRDVVRDFAVENGFTLSRRKNQKTMMTYLCSVGDCPWRLHASVLQDGNTIKIKTYADEHTCPRRPRNKEATSIWIARVLAEEFVHNPRLSLHTMKSKLKEMYGLENESRTKLYRARQMAIKELEGRHKEPVEALPCAKYVNSQREGQEPAPAISESMKPRTVRCKVCGQLGHNKRSCQEARKKRRKKRRHLKEAATDGGIADGEEMEMRKVEQGLNPGVDSSTRMLDESTLLERIPHQNTPGGSQSQSTIMTESVAFTPQKPLSARARAILRKTVEMIPARKSQPLEANMLSLEGTYRQPLEILERPKEVTMEKQTKVCKQKIRSTTGSSSAATQSLDGSNTSSRTEHVHPKKKIRKLTSCM